MKPGFLKKSMISDLITGVSLAIILISIALTAISYFSTLADLKNKFNNQSAGKLETFATILIDPVWNINSEEIERLITLFSQSDDIVEIDLQYVNDRHNRKKEGYNKDYLLVMHKNVVYNNNIIATLSITFSMEQIIINARNNIYITLLIITGIMITIVFTIIILSKFFIERPFSQMISSIDRIAQGMYGHQISPVRQNDINTVIDRFNNMSRQIAARDQEINQAQQFLNNIIDSMPTILITTDEKSMVTHWNQAASRFFGISSRKATGKILWNLAPQLQKYRVYQEKVLHESRSIELRREQFSDPDTVYMNLFFYPLLEGDFRGMVLSMDNITELERKDQQLQQSQKMETLGSLAGGLAHDFNNVLAGIVGTLSLIKYRINKNDALDMEMLKENIDVMEEAGQRAADLVKQLLTLARKDKVEPVVLDLNDSLRHVIKICINTFDRSINIEPELSGNKALVKADPSQIEQLLLNICVNASHAMTLMREEQENWGGTLSVTIERISVDQFFIETHPDAAEQEYWNVSIRDTGVGMDSKTLTKIFDPFFTTKAKGTGTGLGLSMVYNIVRQHKGFMDVYSEIGFGSTFNIFLPEYHGEEQETVTENDQNICKGEGLILIIDDEPAMRRLARSILEECGYTVITAKDGADGLEKYSAYKESVILILLDIIMPVMSGDEAYFKLKSINPDIKILLTSGFRQDERLNKKLKNEEINFIQKPFTMKKLSEAVNATLYHSTENKSGL